ncbi:MAG: S8 family serine peptidase [Candidatus Hermodarchaeota archaeon]
MKKKSNHLILIIIFFSYFIIPLIGIQFGSSDPYDLNYNNTIMFDSLPFSFTTQFNTDNIDLKSNSDYKISKFDEYLNEFLINISLAQCDNQNDISIIIHFKNSIPKEERIEIIDSIFKGYDLITNYDFIPGIHLNVNPDQLIEKANIIELNIAITKIYKSRVYPLPYIDNNDLQPSALDEADFSNWWLSAIGAENLSYNGTGVKVAVIDTGIYPHPDLNIINNSNFVSDELESEFNDNFGHGTHIAGIIGGNGGGSFGQYIGVAPGVYLINARAGNASGLFETDIIKAIQWSAKPIKSGGAGADIISLSIGGGYPYISDSITQAISYAKNNYGVIFVSSAGNSGPGYYTSSTPASGIDVIAVGATNKNDELASFSSWGPTFGYIGLPDVVAPGVNIISADAFNSVLSKVQRYIGDYFDFAGIADYIPLSGTSMSCPVVAGALAILLEAFPNLTPETARIALLEGARKLESGNDSDILKSGAGIINVTASLNYLTNLSPDYNNTAKLYPDELPIKPFDLLHFPGDHQKFNLTVISGKSNIINIEIPNNIQGVILSLDNSTIEFFKAGVKFVELDIQINQDAFPGERKSQINLTIGGQIYDTAEITLDIRLPEYRILMDSYHGLNDWFPEPLYSFYQIGFYEAMKDLSVLNISIDYYMEYWTPDYNKKCNNSILTEEKLAQYDAIFLQNPIIPYSPLEIDNLVQYFESGGNLLFLGTRYQDMVVENINYLFSRLGVDIQINKENVMDDNWLGIGTSVSSQSVDQFNNQEIFKDVSKFYWRYGNSFTVSNNANSIATINSTTVAAMFNGTSQGKGRFIAFGDLHWIYDRYDSASYSQDHSNLLKNVIEFLLPKEDVSIYIDINKFYSSDPEIDLTIYLKNQTSAAPVNVSDFTSLEVIISNNSFSKQIILNTTFSENGIYFNNSYNLPYPSFSPYKIEINLVIDSDNFTKTSKILFFIESEIPKIINLSSDLPIDDLSITRALGESTNLIAELDSPSYGDIEGYFSIYSYSFYNTRESVNKTLTFKYSIPNGDYRASFTPLNTDPSGIAIFYIIPTNSNYTNPYSPRYSFEIINHPPEILEETSNFNYGGSDTIYFEDTETDEGTYIIPTTQGDIFNFEVAVRDTVNYEDDNSAFRVFTNLFIIYGTEDGYSYFMYPQTIEVTELNYQATSDTYEGSYTIPEKMLYSSITGIKSISTASNFDFNTNRGFLGVLVITVYDSEGGTDEFYIILRISPLPIDLSLIIIILLSIIALIGVISMIVYYSRKKKYPRVTQVQPRYEEYYYKPYDEELEEESYVTPEPLTQLGPSMYCPFCGEFLKVPKKFCPHCGESLTFNQQNE